MQPDPQGVYEALLDETRVDGLVSIDPQHAVLPRLEDRFSPLDYEQDGSSGSAYWHPDETKVIEFHWSSQHLHAIARGKVINDELNFIIDTCVDLTGARLYDPQVGERFDF